MSTLHRRHFEDPPFNQFNPLSVSSTPRPAASRASSCDRGAFLGIEPDVVGKEFHIDE